MGFHKGDKWENIINKANDEYLINGIALVQKIPTPMKIIRKNGIIVNAFFEKKSTVDYMGIFDGKPICFEAKECNEVKGFPLKNIHEHQYNFMKSWVDHGGFAFILLKLNSLDKMYIIPFNIVDQYYTSYMNNRGKRGFGVIKSETLDNECWPVYQKDLFIDYLAAIRWGDYIE